MDSTTQHQEFQSLGEFRGMALLYKKVGYTSSIQFLDPTGNASLIATEWKWNSSNWKFELLRKEKETEKKPTESRSR